MAELMTNLFQLLLEKLKEKSIEYLIITCLIAGGYYMLEKKNQELTYEIKELIAENKQLIAQRNAAILAYMDCCNGKSDLVQLAELRKMINN